MELPHLGEHCDEASCHRLDFLPYRCQFCTKTFCQDHYRPKEHSCPNVPETLDRQATVCPVCSRVVPVNRDEDPNIRVERHIAEGCPDPGTSTLSAPSTRTSSPAAKRPGTCSMKRCTKKELVPIQCPSCGRTFCIRHRLDVDHHCEGIGSGANGSGRSPLPRNTPPSNRKGPASSGAQSNRGSQPSQQRQPTSGSNRSAGTNLTEEEQIALAIQMSLEESKQKNPPSDAGCSIC
ncbi:uncharacterized protein BJ171DRAFT_538055 [Polychytrium aggregatum]|uniref:uncharacterized protein n=1 Tax=Polychytrium aggregatum TaxID=110093 RepID=UPI0022FDD406|nr:uncharacterized protein BJ171DRAFT_538055 [Polychytrium aggregatum]KAI9192920.1 hypothetical protein BJ171DRAFT_538055 [Polychytrium aggregatum]